MPGISHRPVFAAEPLTALALNNIPASCLTHEWREVKPVYGSPLAERRQYPLKTKPKALTAAIAKYVFETKRNRELEKARKMKRTQGLAILAAQRAQLMRSSMPSISRRRDDTRPP